MARQSSEEFFNTAPFRIKKNLLERRKYEVVMLRFLFTLFLFSPLFGSPFLERPTFFQYEKDQLEALKNLDSPLRMNRNQLRSWDALVEKHFVIEPNYVQEVRLFTYLYMAQAEAAKLSYQTHKDLQGSLSPLSREVVTLFIPELKVWEIQISDPLSEQLTAMILPKIIARKEKEEKRAHFEAPEKYREYYTVGLPIASWIPWFAKPQEKYWPKQPPKPNDPVWKEQIEEIKKEQKPMTAKKKEAIYFWAGLSGPQTGDWRVITNDYLFSRDIPFPKMLAVRQAIMVGLYDGSISSFHAKYNYLVDRPSRKDPTLKTEIDIPGHPSYPSNHSYSSSSSAYILTHFFPQDKKRWDDLCEEAGMSRIWAGIHYPMDHKEGKETGQRLGEAVIKELQD
jgi:hypothetical protein